MVSRIHSNVLLDRKGEGSMEGGREEGGRVETEGRDRGSEIARNVHYRMYSIYNHALAIILPSPKEIVQHS